MIAQESAIVRAEVARIAENIVFVSSTTILLTMAGLDFLNGTLTNVHKDGPLFPFIGISLFSWLLSGMNSRRIKDLNNNISPQRAFPSATVLVKKTLRKSI